MLKIFNQITKIVSTRRKFSFIVFIIITFIASFVDMISIGLTIPFIGLFLDYEKTKILLEKFNFLNLSLDEPGIYYSITSLFIIMIISSTIFKTFQSYFGTKLSDMLRYEISSNFYLKLINLRYLNHNYINENNSNSNVIKINLLSGFISASLSFITHFLNITLICILLTLIDVKIFLYLLLLGILLITINQSFRNLLIKNGKLMSISFDKRTQILNNTIGYLPFIIINNLKEYFYKSYTKVEYQIAKSNMLILFFSKIPNLVFMTIVTSIIAVTVLYYKINLTGDVFVTKISIITGIVLALLRSLPQLVNLQGSLSALRSHRKVAEDVLEYINKVKSNHYKIEKKANYKTINKIEFKNLGFNYDANNKKKQLIKNLNFTINKGDKIFIYGPSGSGKTTILKLILGLLKPNSGKILVNSQHSKFEKFASSEKRISYVPQDIFLSNASFLENLTIGLDYDQVDMNKVINNCKIVKIHDFIKRKKNGYKSEVSHNARNISGGQKQRLGIARALLRKPEILILDESTSSMDSKTEISVLKNIQKELKNKTIICISHNKDLSKSFSKKFILKDKKLIKC